MAEKIFKITKTVEKAWLESTGHSLWGPSSLKSIGLCPGKVIATLNSPVQPSSVYAEKGTLLHNYCEEAFTKQPDNPIAYVNEQNWKDEDKVLVIDALDYVVRVKAKHTGHTTIKLEAEGSLASWGSPEVEGTMDVVIESAARVDVLDYKFGFGIQVFAHNNPQCAAYLGAAVPYVQGSQPDAELYVHIVQPTLSHYDEWKVSWQELCFILLDDIPGWIMDAKKSNPEYHPSLEACRFCNANKRCEHRLSKVRTQAQQVIKASKNPATITKDKWKILLDAADDLGQAIKDCRAYAAAEIQSGRGFPGYKMIAGRSVRKFKDKVVGDDYIKEQLGDKAWKKPEVISLAQAEKAIPGLKKSDNWKSLITKPSGKPVLVKEEDRRPAVQFHMENEFALDAEKLSNVKVIADPFSAK